MKLYVGNLPYTVDDAGLKKLFDEFGEVASATIIVDRVSNRSKGFGFVEFNDDESAKKAAEKLNGKEVEGREIVVNEARPMKERPQRNFGSGGFNR